MEPEPAAWTCSLDLKSKFLSGPGVLTWSLDLESGPSAWTRSLDLLPRLGVLTWSLDLEVQTWSYTWYPALETGPGAWGLDFERTWGPKTWGPNLWSRPGVLKPELGDL